MKKLLYIFLGIGLGLTGTAIGASNVSLTKDRTLQYLNYLADSLLIGGTATTSDARLSVFGSTTVSGTGMFGGELRVPNIVATSSATSTFPFLYSSTSTISNLNGVIYVDGVRYAKTSSGIDSAINQACSSSSGGKVVLTAGTYTFSSFVTLKSNCIIQGQGSSTYLTLGNTVNTPLFKTLSTVTKCELSDFSIYGNSANNTSPGPSGNMGIALRSGTNNCHIHDISIDSVYNNGIELDASDNNLIENVHTSNNGQGIRVTNGSDDNVIQNSVSDHDQYGIFLYHNNTDTFSYRNRVINNTVKNGYGTDDVIAQSAGISLTGAPYSIISHNTILNNATRGIEVFSTSTGTIVNENIVIGNGTTTYTSGIDTGPDADLIISKNYIEGSGAAGIYLSGNTQNTVIGNVIKNNGQSGSDAFHQYGGITIQENNADGTAPVRNNIVTGNRVYDDQAVPTQQYGIVEAWTGTQNPAWYTNNVYSGNIMSGNVLDDFKIISTSSAVYGNIFTEETNPFSVVTGSTTKLFTVLTGGNVGISTSSPYAKLSVSNTGTSNSFVVDDQANDTTPFIIDSAGKVGIGTTAPADSVEIAGGELALTGRTTQNANANGLMFWGGTAGGVVYARGDASGANDNLDLRGLTDIVLSTYPSGSLTERLRILNNGNTGIGTSSPYAKLSVVGEVVGAYFTGTTTATSTFGGNLAINGTGTTTSAGGFNISAGCYAIGGVCLNTSGVPYPFSLAENATSTLTQFNGGLTAFASSTIGNGTQQGGLTVNGGATTTGNLIVQGTGTSSVYSKFEIRPVGTQSAGDFTVDPVNKTVYIGRLSATGGDHSTFQVRDRSGSDIFSVIPSSAFVYFGQPSVGGFGVGTTSPMSRFSILNTGAGGTVRIDDQANDTTPFVVDNDGNTGIGTTTPAGKLGVNGSLFVGNSSTSTFTGGLNVQGLFQVGTSSIMLRGDGTSTFSNGIDITSGCLRVNGTCISAGAPGSGASSTLLADGNNWTGLNSFSNLFSASSTLGTWLGSAGSTTNLFASEMRATLGNFSNFFSSSSTIGTWLGTNGTTTNLGFTQATGTALTLSQPLGVASGGSGSNDGSILGSGGYAKRTRNNITPTTISEMDSAFSDFYGRGTIAFSTTEYKSGTSSLSITVSNDGLNTGARWNTPDFDASRDNFSFWVKSTNWSQLATAELLLSTNGAFVSFFSVDLKSFLVSPPNNEWIEVIVPRSNFTRNGSPDWSTVNDIIFRATGSGGNTPTWYVDRFSRHKQSQQGSVAIVFDDGSVSQYTTAKPIMDKYNVPGTAYVIWNEVGIGGAMSQAQVNELSDMGWDIGGHGGTNLTTLSASALETDLQGMKRYLMKYGYKGSEHYALPNGAYSSTTLPIVQKYFSTQRTIDSFTNTANYLNPARISAFSPSNLTATSTLYRKIDEAISNGDFLVITFHKIVASPSTDTEWSTTQFTEFIEYVKNSGIKTVTMSEAMNGNIHSSTDRNDRVGYGTSTPYAQLSVWGNSLSAALMQVNGSASSTFFQVNNDGNVGVGTTSPYARLSVAGQVAAEIFTATSTTGTSTFPNVNITTGVTLFGSTAASANAFCVILTGSADLCDGSDAGGAGGAQTPWTSNINAATFGVSGLSYVTASSTTATSSFNILSIGSTTPSSMDMFSVGSSSPLMSISGRSGKIGFGTTNESPARWAFGSGLNVNINPNINLLVQDQADARLGAAVSDNGIFLKAPTSDTGAAGIFAFNYQGGTAMDINLQEFGAKIGIGTSTPWAKFSVVPSGSNPAMVIATTTAWNSTGFYIKEQISSIFSRNWWTTFIGGATSTDRYDRLGSSVTIFGRLNSDTLIAQVDPISSAAFVAGLTADSVVTAGGPGWIFDDITDGHLTTTSQGTTSVSIGGGGPTGITNGCNDGGAWLVLRANEATGATANNGAWVRGSGEFDVKNTVTGVPAAIPGGMLTSTGTPVMEVTICTPHMTTQAASSTILAPASYAFGFGDHVIGAGPFSSTFTAPNNAAALVATNTENWILLNKNTAASASAQSSGAVQVDTGISTSTTLTSPQTFRIAMTATSTYAYRYNSNTGLWDSIGVNTTQQTKRNFTWFIGVQKPGVAAGRSDLMFRNLKVWYSPQYRF